MFLYIQKQLSNYSINDFYIIVNANPKLFSLYLYDSKEITIISQINLHTQIFFSKYSLYTHKTLIHLFTPSFLLILIQQRRNESLERRRFSPVWLLYDAHEWRTLFVFFFHSCLYFTRFTSSLLLYRPILLWLTPVCLSRSFVPFLCSSTTKIYINRA